LSLQARTNVSSALAGRIRTPAASGTESGKGSADLLLLQVGAEGRSDARDSRRPRQLGAAVVELGEERSRHSSRVARPGAAAGEDSGGSWHEPFRLGLALSGSPQAAG